MNMLRRPNSGLRSSPNIPPPRYFKPKRIWGNRYTIKKELSWQIRRCIAVPVFIDEGRTKYLANSDATRNRTTKTIYFGYPGWTKSSGPFPPGYPPFA